MMPGATCNADRLCVSPFSNGGCLANLMPGWNKVRVCHSEDSPEAEALGYCRPPDPGMDYTEIRIASQNWEAVFMEAWMLQILLSEVLGVPATIETGTADAHLDFYDPLYPLDYGTSNHWGPLRRSLEVGDCRLVGKNESLFADYPACAHVVPEVWNLYNNEYYDLRDAGVVEAAPALGVIGQQNWFITRFTAEQDPTLLTHFGMAGQDNRRKLADTFLRPTTWNTYCQFLSPSRCREADDVAARAPQDSAEKGRYFADGLFTGHFRKTAENDCDTYPDICTGHIADYPCGWTSSVQQQAHHLGIALQSSGSQPGSRGYDYNELTDIVAAANATKSNLMMQWWTPDALYQKFLGTDAELQAVSLPPPTQRCVEAAVKSSERCSEDYLERIGSPDGACMEPPQTIRKLIGNSLWKITQDPARIPPARQSPAYEAIKAYTITGLQLGDLFESWRLRGGDSGFDLRYITCAWMVSNWDEIEQFIPRGYPRVSQKKNQQVHASLYYVALILAIIAAAATVATTVATYRQRHRMVMRHAQVEFLFLLLAGLMLLTVGSITSVLPPSIPSCVATIWFTNLGYTLELAPLIVKVAAINRLMSAAQQLRRVHVNRKSLFGMVYLLCFFVVVFLLLWSIFDTPVEHTSYRLSDDQRTNEDGDTIVWMHTFCQSDSDGWLYGSAVWHSLLLLSATVLAFQTRRLRSEFNEAQTLALMIYSHFLFLILRIITFSIETDDNQWETVRYRSLIFSADAIATLLIYFVSKFTIKEERVLDRQRQQALMAFLDQTPPGMAFLDNTPPGSSGRFRPEAATNSRDGKPPPGPESPIATTDDEAPSDPLAEGGEP